MGFWVFFSDDRSEYYDSDACALFLSPDQTVEITDHSKIILDYLIENRNAALYRDQILGKVDGIEAVHSKDNKRAYRNPVDQAIVTLRKKLGKYAGCIGTVRGVGYKYIGPPKKDKESPASQPDESGLPSSGTEGGARGEAFREARSGAAAGSARSPDGAPESVSIEGAIKKAGIQISVFEIIHGRRPPGAAVEPFIEQIISAFLDNMYRDILGISAEVWREYEEDRKAQAILQAYIHEVNNVRDLTPDDSNTRG